MKPVYQNFIEKNMQQMAVSAAEMAINNTTAMANGKLHNAWWLISLVCQTSPFEYRIATATYKMCKKMKFKKK